MPTAREKRAVSAQEGLPPEGGDVGDQGDGEGPDGDGHHGGVEWVVRDRCSAAHGLLLRRQRALVGAPRAPPSHAPRRASRREPDGAPRRSDAARRPACRPRAWRCSSPPPSPTRDATASRRRTRTTLDAREAGRVELAFEPDDGAAEEERPFAAAQPHVVAGGLEEVDVARLHHQQPLALAHQETFPEAFPAAFGQQRAERLLQGIGIERAQPRPGDAERLRQARHGDGLEHVVERVDLKGA